MNERVLWDSLFLRAARCCTSLRTGRTLKSDKVAAKAVRQNVSYFVQMGNPWPSFRQSVAQTQRPGGARIFS